VFYATLAAQLSGLDVASSAPRHAVAPLNPPGPGVAAAEAAAARVASTAGFPGTMFLSAALLAYGAAINAVGIRRAPSVGAS